MAACRLCSSTKLVCLPPDLFFLEALSPSFIPAPDLRPDPAQYSGRNALRRAGLFCLSVAPLQMPMSHEYAQPCSALASDHCGGSPACSSGAASPHAAFLASWRAHVAPRLIQLLQRLQQEQVAQVLAVAQVRAGGAAVPAAPTARWPAQRSMLLSSHLCTRATATAASWRARALPPPRLAQSALAAGPSAGRQPPDSPCLYPTPRTR